MAAPSSPDSPKIGVTEDLSLVQPDTTNSSNNSNNPLHGSTTPNPAPNSTHSSHHSRQFSEDIERGLDAESMHTDTVGSGSQSPSDTTITIIDVDSKGVRNTPLRYASRDVCTSDSVSDGFVRIICRETLQLDVYLHGMRGIMNALDIDVANIFGRKSEESGPDFEHRSEKKPPGRMLRVPTALKLGHPHDLAYPIMRRLNDVILQALWNGKAQKRFNMQQFQNLWRKPAIKAITGFIIQTNLSQSAFPENTKAPGPDDENLVMISAPQRIHRAYMTLSSRYWKAFVEVTMEHLERSTQVFCTFPAPLLLKSRARRSSINDTRVISTMQSAFEDFLLSSDSALEFCNGDSNLTSKLIVLDLLRSSMQMWDSFFSEFGYWEDVPSLELGEDLKEFEADVSAHEGFSTTIRDLGICLSFLITSIETQFNVQSPVNGSSNSQSWQDLVLEVNAMHTALQNTANDLLNRAHRNFSFVVANLNQKQASSARTLTIVASIFLPLTLSSSLLAMNVPAAKIGPLWYDWIGLWLTLGFAVIVVLFFSKGIHNILATRGANIIVTYVGLFFGDKRISFAISTLLFAAVITSSFLAGMFYNKHTAVDILKYGMPAFCASAFLIMLFGLIWKGLQMLLSIVTFLFAFPFALRQLRKLGGTLGDHFALFSFDDSSDISEEEVLDMRRKVLKAWASSIVAKRWVQHHRDFLLLSIGAYTRDRNARLRSIKRIAAEDDTIASMLGDFGLIDRLIGVSELRPGLRPWPRL